MAEYAAGSRVDSASAIRTARHCLIDALGGSFEVLRDPECAALIGPIVPGAMMPGGARVPGTSLELDPVQGAFCTGLMLCRAASRSGWLTLRDSRAIDTLGPLLAVADYQGRKAMMEGTPPPKVRDVLAAWIRTLGIQSALGPERAAFIGFAPVATAAVVTAQLGGSRGQVVTALSHACIDGRIVIEPGEPYADAGRRDWIMADAISRAVRHACQAMAAGSREPISLDLEAADCAAARLGAGPWSPKNPFGTAIIDQIAAARGPREAAEMTVGFQAAVDRYFPARQAERIKALFAVPGKLDDLPVNELLAALVTNGKRPPAGQPTG